MVNGCAVHSSPKNLSTRRTYYHNIDDKGVDKLLICLLPYKYSANCPDAGSL